MDDLDLFRFWQPSEYAEQAYVGAPVTAEAIAMVERTLGYTLPRAYIELMKSQNGGIPQKTCHRTPTPTSWSPTHIAITGIFAIGSQPSHSLCGTFGSQFWIDEWGYPAIGVYFADCPSAGHDLLCLDYRVCGPHGEPQVVHVDQEFDYAITAVAESFAAFIRGLEDEQTIDAD